MVVLHTASPFERRSVEPVYTLGRGIFEREASSRHAAPQNADEAGGGQLLVEAGEKASDHLNRAAETPCLPDGPLRTGPPQARRQASRQRVAKDLPKNSARKDTLDTGSRFVGNWFVADS